jgi:hypothetical protein
MKGAEGGGTGRCMLRWVSGIGETGARSERASATTGA